MDAVVGRDRFCEVFEGRAVVVPALPAGRSGVLAGMASEVAGGGGSLRTRAQYLALFDVLAAHVPPVPPSALRRDSARAQLKRLRQAMPRAAGDFPAAGAPLPRAA